MGFIINPYLYSGVLVYDTFTDSDSTAISSHTPDIDVVGGGWSTSGSGTGVISGNTATNTATGAGSNVFAEIETNNSDVVITASLKCDGASSFCGVLGRIVDANNRWQFLLSAAADAVQAQLLIQEVNGGSNTQRDTTGLFSYTVGTWLSVTITMNGTSLEFTDGTHTASYSSSLHQTATKHGFVIDDTNSGLAQDYVDTLTISSAG